MRPYHKERVMALKNGNLKLSSSPHTLYMAVDTHKHTHTDMHTWRRVHTQAYENAYIRDAHIHRHNESMWLKNTSHALIPY